jgi:hypothetical protein
LQGTTGATGDTGAQGTTGLQGITGSTGTQGTTGLQGTSGTNGTNGQGVPVGGTTGQALTKINGTDYNTQWTTVAASSHTHAAADVTSGTFAIGRIPTGTTGTTVSLGNHVHTIANVTALQTSLDAKLDKTQYSDLANDVFQVILALDPDEKRLWIDYAGSLRLNGAGITVNGAGITTDGTLSAAALTTSGTLTRSGLAGGGSTTATINNTGQFIRTTSSARYKDDIQAVTYPYQDILALQPKTFKLKDEVETETEPRTYGGLIAEEVDQIDSLKVFVNYKTLEDGSKIPDGIAYGEMVSALVSAIQQQDTMIKSLESRITQLER